MSNVQEALKAAIRELKELKRVFEHDNSDYEIRLCEAALSEIDKCEPVKGVIISEGSPTLLSDKYIKATDIRLYTSPPQQQWVGLTYDQKMDLKENNEWYNFPSDLIEATEAKLKQLNTEG